MNKREVQYVSIPDRRRSTHDRRKYNQIDPVVPCMHSDESEQSVLGALLLDNSKWCSVAEILGMEDFYRDDHRRIYEAICWIIASNQVADVVTVFARIESRNESDQTGGLSYLGEIANNTPSAANILTYARIVRERALQRALAGFGDLVTAIATGAGSEPLADRFRAAQEAWGKVKAEYLAYRPTSWTKSAPE